MGEGLGANFVLFPGLPAQCSPQTFTWWHNQVIEYCKATLPCLPILMLPLGAVWPLVLAWSLCVSVMGMINSGYLKGLFRLWDGAGHIKSPQSMLATIIISSLPHRALISQRPINRSAPSSRDLKKKKKPANEILHEIIVVIFLLPGQIIRVEVGGGDLAVIPLARTKKGH